ncbi:NadS family protein [Morganella morganii]|uniref:NadS family protein n=1 Tax=Morganella morganii TaxID=582 RepID=UPI001826FB8C|nr:NadS family protein [Morganella morganii]HAG7874792.1 helix-turn-helix domain-containing protein [Escherichia coli]EKT0592524.1 helix-turn-helix domain-containing protein [Morganella morganii]EKU0270978.1 helix-turn-helix domain-containing protein [Morganella morganii]ELF0885177.1 helix-turn-helix domain-containing protein [Morganella morganii]MBT0389530.1 helix-turn-helix domain-containing protein [Morganella morganii subsp. morganii]
MDKTLFENLVSSMEEMVAIEKGHVVPAQENRHRHPIPDVKAIRKHAGLKQTEFADAIGSSVDLVRSWEQHRRIPSGIALKMLYLIEKQPALLCTLRSIPLR